MMLYIIASSCIVQNTFFSTNSFFRYTMPSMVLENGIALAKSVYTNIKEAIKVNCIPNDNPPKNGKIGYSTNLHMNSFFACSQD